MLFHKHLGSWFIHLYLLIELLKRHVVTRSYSQGDSIKLKILQWKATLFGHLSLYPPLSYPHFSSSSRDVIVGVIFSQGVGTAICSQASNQVLIACHLFFFFYDHFISGIIVVLDYRHYALQAESRRRCHGCFNWVR